MLYNEDTIAAISTPMGYGGISIVRISGKEAFAICDKLFVRPNEQSFSDQSVGTICYGHIVNNQGDILDEVLVSKMKAPHTFTAEDVAEINCHGGLNAVKSVLDEILRNGARVAQAGEFTKRAFINGRIDLSQAEAVSDIITAKTALSTKAALSQLSGVLSDEIDSIKQMLLTLLADLEVTIQYPEYDVPDMDNEELQSTLRKIQEKISQLIDSYKTGEILREGLKVVIAGKPNVGKSLLLNRLIKKNKAIVTDIPGTTRDAIDEYMSLGGIPIILIDTAGIRDSEDIVESIGIQKTKDSIEKADLVIFVTDISAPLSAEDQEIYESIRDKDHIVVLNKADAPVVSETESYFAEADSVIISALTKEGLPSLEAKLSEFVLGENKDIVAEAVVSNARHKTLLESAKASINGALDALIQGLPVDLIETDIRDTWASLGMITGETADEDIINEIFSKFCLGK